MNLKAGLRLHIPVSRSVLGRLVGAFQDAIAKNRNREQEVFLYPGFYSVNVILPVRMLVLPLMLMRIRKGFLKCPKIEKTIEKKGEFIDNKAPNALASGRDFFVSNRKEKLCGLRADIIIIIF